MLSTQAVDKFVGKIGHAGALQGAYWIGHKLLKIYHQ
jgi:hypothetical protein